MPGDPVSSEIHDICVKLLRLPPDKIVPEARLIEDLDIDSLFAAELAQALERKFKITIPDDAIPSLKTVAELTEFVNKKLVLPSA